MVEPDLTLGCWCYLPVAVRLPEKDCYLREQGYDASGWPDHLRPHESNALDGGADAASRDAKQNP